MFQLVLRCQLAGVEGKSSLQVRKGTKDVFAGMHRWDCALANREPLQEQPEKGRKPVWKSALAEEGGKTGQYTERAVVTN